MKKLILIAAIFIAAGVSAQVPAQRQDSLLNPHRSDSSDFRDPSPGGDSLQPQFRKDTYRRDSLPIDDRKPKDPPKK